MKRQYIHKRKGLMTSLFLLFIIHSNIEASTTIASFFEEKDTIPVRDIESKKFIRFEKFDTINIPIFLTGNFAWSEQIKDENANKLEIKEIYPNVLYFNQFYDFQNEQYLGFNRKIIRPLKNEQPSQSPSDVIEIKSSIVPWKMEFYDSTGVFLNKYDIIENNPFSQRFYSSKICENCWNEEIGFADKSERGKAKENGQASIYGNFINCKATEGNIGFFYVQYTLNGYNVSGAWLWRKDAIRVFNSYGNVIFQNDSLDYDPWHLLVSSDGKHLVINFGGRENINNISDKSPAGISIIDIKSGVEIHREYSDSPFKVYSGSWQRGDYIKDDIVDLYSEIDDYAEETILFDLKNNLKYSRIFTEQERMTYMNYFYKNDSSNMFQYLIDNYDFQIQKL